MENPPAGFDISRIRIQGMVMSKDRFIDIMKKALAKSFASMEVLMPYCRYRGYNDTHVDIQWVVCWEFDS